MAKDLEARLAELEARAKAAEDRASELESKLHAKRNTPLSCKVSSKGAVSVYGLQRFPVTLYAAQWERLAKDIGRVIDFIASNPDGLSTKPEQQPAA
jgi:hypothetical protein